MLVLGKGGIVEPRRKTIGTVRTPPEPGAGVQIRRQPNRIHPTPWIAAFSITLLDAWGEVL
jgi:hypothetical protein